jgi:hypothetical protein
MCDMDDYEAGIGTFLAIILVIAWNAGFVYLVIHFALKYW